MKTLVSLCDFSGSWAQPYIDAGWLVFLVDPKHETPHPAWNAINCSMTVQDFCALGHRIKVDGVLAAPPCTHFAGSGAQYWKAKDSDGRTDAHLEIVDACLEAVQLFQPRFWALENPVGRLHKLRPELGKPWYFQPHWYGDPYTKKTGLWGSFNKDLPRNDVEPIRACKQGSHLQRLGGKSERTKMLRSITPQGFAAAFFEANQ